jgi:hypothetical protein
MTFEGCKCAACKCVAVGMVCWGLGAAGYHDQFCRDWGQQRGAYCDGAWDMPHGPHNDQRPFDQQRGPTIVSTSSSNGTTNGTTVGAGSLSITLS